MEEENVFEKMEKTINQEEEEEELGMEIFSQGSFISSPEVGESIKFTVNKIVKNPNTQGINKTTGEKFNIGCTKKSGETIRYDIITTDNDRFTLNSWSLFYMFVSKDSKFAKFAQKKGSMKGINVKLTRKYDGSVPNKKNSDVMKLYNLTSLDEAENYKKEVAKALKEGRLFEIEIC